MPKPSHQWETRLHQAFRLDAPARALGERGESFELRFADGRRGTAHCGLARQRVDAIAATDPDLVHAVSCWLVARGARAIDLQTEGGESLASGPIHLDRLGDFGDSADSADSADSSDWADSSDSWRSDLPPPPRRLVSLCPSNAELLGSLACFDRVVACEDSSDFPPEVETVERLGPDLGPDLDRVAALGPDLVLSSLTVPGMERNVTGLRARGVPQVVLAPRSIADVLAELALLGRLLGVRERADEVRATMLAEVERLRERAATRERPARVYLEWWPRPMFTPGRACYSNELIALAGGVNVFAERPGSSLEIAAEELLAADPEVCFVSWCGVAKAKLDPKRLIGRAGLESLPAARAGAVFALDERFSGRPGPRMLEAARVMAAGIESALG